MTSVGFWDLLAYSTSNGQHNRRAIYSLLAFNFNDNNINVLRMLSSMPHIHLLVVLVSFLSSNDSFKLLGMPRFLPKASATVASSVTGQDLSKVAMPVRTLESIGLPQPRELQSITDRDFSEQILETNGLAIVLFTRYAPNKDLIPYTRKTKTIDAFCRYIYHISALTR
jgi:hypothetical protein